MKYYKLIYGDNIIPAAVSEDKWLLELFIVQRKLAKKKCSIFLMDKTEKYKYPDQFLIYYFGYPVTSLEYRYVCDMNAEYESSIHWQIYELENTLSIYEKSISKKERKWIKKTIKTLERLDVSRDMEHVKRTLETVIERPGLIIDYLENLDEFRRCMEG